MEDFVVLILILVFTISLKWTEIWQALYTCGLATLNLTADKTVQVCHMHTVIKFDGSFQSEEKQLWAYLNIFHANWSIVPLLTYRRTDDFIIVPTTRVFYSEQAIHKQMANSLFSNCTFIYCNCRVIFHAYFIVYLHVRDIVWWIGHRRYQESPTCH